MQKVLITAANCFIGRKLCKKLTENGYFVYATVRSTFSGAEIFDGMDNLKIIYCDMCDYGSLQYLVNGRCDIGIALAWNGTRGSDRADMSKQEQNYKETMQSIESFIQIGCKTIMTAGSQAEYGSWCSTEKVKETDPCNPNTEYGKAKLKVYQHTKALCEQNGIRLIEPRFFSLYGADDVDETMIVSMIKNMLRNKECNLTKCTQIWDFLYIDDAIEALYKLIESNHADGIYNFGSGVSKPLREYVERMYQLTHSNSKLNYGAIDYPPTGIVHTNPSIDKLTNEINWRPMTSFQDGIKKVIAYQRKGTL